jgi:hypothetical protein
MRTHVRARRRPKRTVFASLRGFLIGRHSSPPILPASPLHRWRLEILHLHPMRRAAGANQQSQSGDWAHEAQCICFVWSGHGAAYRNDGADAFSRYAFRERHWRLKVLRRQRRNRKILSRGSTAIHCKNERTPYATRLENITATIGASRHKMRE